MQEHPVLRRCRKRGAATIPEGHLPGGRVGVPLLHRPASIHQRCGNPIGVLQRVQPFIQCVIAIRIPVPQDRDIDLGRAPDIAGMVLEPTLVSSNCQSLLKDRSVTMDPTMSVTWRCRASPPVTHEHHIGGVLDLDYLAPVIVDEAEVVLVTHHMWPTTSVANAPQPTSFAPSIWRAKS